MKTFHVFVICILFPLLFAGSSQADDNSSEHISQNIIRGRFGVEDDDIGVFYGVRSICQTKLPGPFSVQKHGWGFGCSFSNLLFSTPTSITLEYMPLSFYLRIFKKDIIALSASAMYNVNNHIKEGRRHNELSAIFYTGVHFILFKQETEFGFSNEIGTDFKGRGGYHTGIYSKVTCSVIK